MHVIAHPTDADTVFVMNMKAWKSIDGGKNFEEFHTPHGDNHALWIDPTDPDRMIGCDDGGAWVSINAGASWSTIYNQLTAQFYHVATDDQFPYLVYGSQQDNSSIAVPSRTGLGRDQLGRLLPARHRRERLRRAQARRPEHRVRRGDREFARRRRRAPALRPPAPSRSSSSTCGRRRTTTATRAEVRFQWTYPIVFSPQDSNVLYAAGNKVFRTTDEGHSWEAISPDLTYADPDTLGVSGPLTMDTAGAEMYATIFSLMVSAHQPGVLMAGSDDGLVHVSTNDGGDWANVTPPDLPKFSQVTMIAESPHTPGTVYMTVARHKMGDDAPYVYRTIDLGGAVDTHRCRAAAARVLSCDPRRPEPPGPALRRDRARASTSRSTTARTGSPCKPTCP